MEQTLEKRINSLIGTQNKLSSPLIEKIVNEVLEDQSTEHMSELQKLIAQKEIIEHEIKIQSHKLQEQRQESFNDIERFLKDHFTDIETQDLKTLSQLKLQSFDILDFLREITESAFISAFENGEDIEDAVKEITRDLTHKTLRDGYLTLERARHVVATIISVATELAEATPIHADAILRGSIFGAKKGLIQSIELFKERFAFIPDEIRPKMIRNMQKTYEDLHHTDTLFIQVIQAQANLSSDMINKKLTKHLNEIKPELHDLIKVSREALLMVGERLTKLGKGAMYRGQSVLQSKAAIEAKRMGITVWDVAKGVVGGAISTAKDALDNKKDSKK